MKLSEIKKHLSTAEAVNFKLPSGSYVPEYFHVTEIGAVIKHFIDCGGKERIEKVVNFQLLDANDYEHRLKPQKLIHIIELSENRLGLGDMEIEVEYQNETIGKYALGYNGQEFELVAKKTACLASDSCGIPNENFVTGKLKSQHSCCATGNGAC